MAWYTECEFCATMANIGLKSGNFVHCTIKSPTVCAGLALDSWNYCCGQQGPTPQHIRKIAQLPLHW